MLEYATMSGGTRARAQHQEPSMVVFNELGNDSHVAVYILAGICNTWVPTPSQYWLVRALEWINLVM
jgi:hypothetical protein